jgi:glycine hydroxymethyltransferase
MHTIAAKAVAFKEAMEPDFKRYAKQVISNARALAEALQRVGFRVVSGGTDSHLLVVDLRPVNVTGSDAEKILDSVGITVNKNTIPFDPQPPTVCSGVRMGTPAVTTRGLGVAEMERVATLIHGALQAGGDAGKLATVRGEVRDLAKAFPLYAHRLVRSATR